MERYEYDHVAIPSFPILHGIVLRKKDHGTEVHQMHEHNHHRQTTIVLD